MRAARKKYKLWHSTYVDFLSRRGIGSYVYQNVNDENEIGCGSIYRDNTTINELSLSAIILGLNCIGPIASTDVSIIGCCKYADMAIDRLPNWMLDEEVMGQRPHLEHLTEIYELILRFGDITSTYHVSRATDPVVYTVSQIAMDSYRDCQLRMIADLKHLESPTPLKFNLTDLTLNDLRTNVAYKKPLTDHMIQKKIELARKARDKKIIETDSNVIKFPGA